eukprot:m.104990 g.104990  ORF g.104990 m.104990 type:complete len:85 (+) comp22470_c0_seq1:427-681(+)
MVNDEKQTQDHLAQENGKSCLERLAKTGQQFHIHTTTLLHLMGAVNPLLGALTLTECKTKGWYGKGGNEEKPTNKEQQEATATA